MFFLFLFFTGENGGIETVWARAGTNTSIPCLGAVTGRVSRLQWWREDKMIAEWADGRRITWEGNAHTSLAPSSARFALVFTPVSYSDNGDYQCLVNNQLQPNSGVREGIVRLRVQGKYTRSPIHVLLRFRFTSLYSFPLSQRNFLRSININLVHTR